MNKLNKLAKIFEFKMKYAQESTAQAGDFEHVLKNTNLWEKTNDVAKLVQKAGVPDDASININIAVDKNMNVSYTVLVDPVTPAGSKSAISLSNLLKATFGDSMKKAFIASGLSVSDVVTFKWINF